MGRSSATDLAGELQEYENELVASGLQRRAVQTYVVHASQFVRWLDGRFVPGSRGRGQRPSPTGLRPPVDAREEPRPAASEGVEWMWEGHVQSAVVAWLAETGWAIERVADTKAREHGPDILARRGERRIAVEVKGYPQPVYASGEMAGQPKKWHTASQARTYFATAVHAAMVMRDSLDGVEIAIALPDAPTYRTLATQVRSSLAALGITLLVVSVDKRVAELG